MFRHQPSPSGVSSETKKQGEKKKKERRITPSFRCRQNSTPFDIYTVHTEEKVLPTAVQPPSHEKPDTFFVFILFPNSKTWKKSMRARSASSYYTHPQFSPLYSCIQPAIFFCSIQTSFFSLSLPPHEMMSSATTPSTHCRPAAVRKEVRLLSIDECPVALPRPLLYNDDK